MATIKFIEVEKNQLKKKDPIIHIVYLSGRDIFNFTSKAPATVRRFINENGQGNTYKISCPGYENGRITEKTYFRVYAAGYNIPFYVREN